MDENGVLGSAHRRVVDQFIEAVLDEWACGPVERNILGVALRREIETRLAPELLALHALLLRADWETMGRLPGWLNAVQAPLTLDRDFFEEMGRLLDPTGYEVLVESLGLLPGESETARAFTDCLWCMTPGIPSRRSVT